jgi:hypothetical protein
LKKATLFIAILLCLWGQGFLLFAQKYIDTTPANKNGSLQVVNNYSAFDISSTNNDVINFDNKLNIIYQYVDPYGSSFRQVAGIKNYVTNQSIDNTRGIRTDVINSYSGTEAVNSFNFTTSGGSFFSNANVGNVYGLFGSAGNYSNFAHTGTYYGVRGSANSYNTTGYTYGIYGSASAAVTNNRIFAGYFDGNVHVNGTLSKSAGTFKIDHPLDPLNKYLSHSFVESPDMMNIYNGNITTDQNGRATVTLPAYFEALNIDFRYQLTTIGSPAQAYIFEEVKGNQFIIATDKPTIKVSWQVTGIRNDAYAKKNRVVPVQDKPEQEKGKYLNADAFGLPREESIHAIKNQEPKKD